MSYNVKNYTEQGGEKTVINGVLEFGSDATVEGFPAGSATGMTPAEYQADSTATTVAATVTDFNALLAKLRAAGLMAAEAAEEPVEEPSEEPGT